MVKSPWKKTSPKKARSPGAASPSGKRRRENTSARATGIFAAVARPVAVSRDLSDFLLRNQDVLDDHELGMARNGTFTRARMSRFASNYSKRRAQASLNARLGSPPPRCFWADADFANVLRIRPESAVAYTELQKLLSGMFPAAAGKKSPGRRM